MQKNAATDGGNHRGDNIAVPSMSAPGIKPTTGNQAMAADKFSPVPAKFHLPTGRTVRKDTARNSARISALPVRDAGGFEGGHAVMGFERGGDDGHGERGARAFAESEVQLQQGPLPKLLE